LKKEIEMMKRLLHRQEDAEKKKKQEDAKAA